MADTQSNSLVDESVFPLRSALGAPLDYDAVITGDLLELIGLKDASEEEKQKLYTTMLQTIENRVLARLSDQLSDEDMEAVANITDGEQIAEFFKQRNIDIPSLFAEEALIYKTDLVSLVNRDSNA